MVKWKGKCFEYYKHQWYRTAQKKVCKAMSQTKTYAKQPVLAFTLAHNSHTFGRAPWLAIGARLDKPLLPVPQNEVAYSASDGPGALERATLNLSEQFGMAGLPCVSNVANLVSSL